MNILVVTQSPVILGGANRSLLDVIRLLQEKHGHICYVLAPAKGEFICEASKLGCKCFVSPYLQTSFVEIHDWKYPLRWLKFIKAHLYNKLKLPIAIKQLQSIKFDIVYINDTTNTFGFLIARSLSLPFVWHFRGYQKVIRKYLLNERVLKQSNNGKIINISNAMQTYMKNQRHLPENMMTVIYNGVTNKSLNIQANHRRRCNKEALHCLHCGHISKAKGMEDSINAIRILHSRGYTNIFLHLAGTPSYENGEQYDKYLSRTIIKPNNIDNLIIFEGEVKEIAKLRSSMDVELMCSVAEPFGRTTVEGLQAGLVVIGANTGATPEIINDNYNGLIYQQGNPEDLANKIELIYKNINLACKLSQHALEFSKNNFTMENNVKEINSVFEIVANLK